MSKQGHPNPTPIGHSRIPRVKLFRAQATTQGSQQPFLRMYLFSFPFPFPFPAPRLLLPRLSVSWQEADSFWSTVGLSLNTQCPKRYLVYSAYLPWPGWSSSGKRVFRMRRPEEISTATEFCWGQVGAAVQSRLAWPHSWSGVSPC